MRAALLLNVGAMSRRTPPDAEDQARKPEVRRLDSQRARMAQLLLLARLRARNPCGRAADSLEHAAQVILVTCKHWFAPSRDRAATPEKSTPPPAIAAAQDDNHDNPQGPDAHCHD